MQTARRNSGKGLNTKPCHILNTGGMSVAWDMRRRESIPNTPDTTGAQQDKDWAQPEAQGQAATHNTQTALTLPMPCVQSKDRTIVHPRRSAREEQQATTTLLRYLALIVVVILISPGACCPGCLAWCILPWILA